MGNDSSATNKTTLDVQAALHALRAHLSLRRSAAEIAADFALAAGTLLVVFGLFMGWQSWLIVRQGNAAQALVRVRTQTAKEISRTIAGQRKQAAAALANPALLAQLATEDNRETRAAAARQLRQSIAGAKAVSLYSAALDEVLHDNLTHIGYARAAQLMGAFSNGQLGPARSPHPHIVSFAGPVTAPDGKLLAWGVIDFPDSAMRHALDSAHFPAGRIDLRQTGKTGDIVLDSIGNTSLSTADNPGAVIAHSLYRVATAPPRYWLPVTDSLNPALVLAILTLLGGLGLLGSRPRLRRRPGRRAHGNEPALSDMIAAAPPAPKPPAPVPSPSRGEATASDEVVLERSIFRAYDIRGIVGESLVPAVARQLGRAIGSAVRDRGLSEIVVGRDGRLSGPDFTEALTDGLCAAGVDVIDIGAVPTPVSYFAAYQLNVSSCVSVTGSHNPPNYNGFKIVIGGETLAGEAIVDLYQRLVEGRLSEGQGSLRQQDVRPQYIERIASDVQTGRCLKVVVDGGSGIAGETAPAVIDAIGCESIALYCDVDGNFPHHHPDPSDPKNLADLILMVEKTDADLGLAFDGDGDRLGVVTRQGEIIYPDRVLMLFAHDVLTRNPGATILYDVKCTGHLQPLILEAGGSPLMCKTGHSFIKAKMKQTGAQLAGEMSGHFFFGERWYGFDDGVYAAARLLEILADDPEDRTPEEIFATLPHGVSTPELHVPMAEGENHAFITRFRESAQWQGARISTIDGVRVDWPDGWGLVRASNTTPVLVLRFDADNNAALQRIQDAFREQLLACEQTLELPF